MTQEEFKAAAHDILIFKMGIPLDAEIIEVSESVQECDLCGEHWFTNVSYKDRRGRSHHKSEETALYRLLGLDHS